MDEPLLRWRLVLGAAGEPGLGRGLTGPAASMDAALDFLYGREQSRAGEQGSLTGPRSAGDGASTLTVPEWINAIHTLFPAEVIERLEQDAVERYGITEVVTDPRVLERVDPNPALLRAVLQTKHLMDERLLTAARALVRKVVQQLMDELAEEVRGALVGVIRRSRSSPFAHGPLDLRRTLDRNLARVDPHTRRIVPERLFFFDRSTRRLDRWQIIVVVDQSGSMLPSTIHAAITAAILSGLPGVDSHLVAFDTEVVDLSADVTDPVKTLMSVQLGGGTFIHKAMDYAASLVKVPHRAVVVLITDFFEGGSAGALEAVVRDLCAQGTRVLGLAALDAEAVPSYDRELAARLVAVGAEVGAMTPGQLATWIAEKMRR